MFNHCVEVLGIIKILMAKLQIVKDTLGIGEPDFERYLEEERQYLSRLKSEPEEETLAYQYVEALQ